MSPNACLDAEFIVYICMYIHVMKSREEIINVK